MVNQKIILDCKNINEKAFGILLSEINKTLEKIEMDLYVKTELENKKEKTLIEEIRLGEHDFKIEEIDEVFNRVGIELKDFELCDRETQHRIENKLIVQLN